jgi:hypothetical protein
MPSTAHSTFASVAILLCTLSTPEVASAQGRSIGDAQTLDVVPYGFPESRGAVATGGGYVLSGTVTNVPAGGDHAQLFGVQVGAQQLGERSVLAPVGDGLARAFGSAVALGAGRVVVADPEAALGFVQGRIDSWDAGLLPQGERRTLSPPEPDCALFGSAVESDGARLAVLSRAQGSIAVRGFVYGPDASGGGWVLEDRFSVPEQAGDLAVFGERLAFEGTRLALGAPWRRGGSGGVYVFIESPTTGAWQQETELVAPGLVAFGSEVALSGNVLLAQGSESIGLGARGVVVVFRRSAGVWSEVQRFVPLNSTVWDQFGASIALRGNTALIAAPGRGQLNGADGAVDVWTAHPFTGVWSRTSELVDGSARSGDRFGLDVSLDLNSAPPRVAILASLDGRVQARAVLLPSTLPALLELQSTAGMATCTPNGINSRGTWAKLRALGSSIVARNDVVLEAWDLPASAPILFGASDVGVCAPQGALGSIALGGGGQTARWIPFQAGPTGVIRAGVNLLGLPGPSGPIPALAGTTWTFQGLYRDTVGGRLTEGLRLRLE